MPTSLHITAFLSHYEGLGARVQSDLIRWLNDQKERARAELLLAQLDESLVKLTAAAGVARKKAASAENDAQDAKDLAGVQERAEQAAFSAVEAAVQARDEEELETAQGLALVATQRKEAAHAEARAAQEYINVAESIATAAATAAANAEELLQTAEQHLSSGNVSTWDVCELLNVELSDRLADFKSWDAVGKAVDVMLPTLASQPMLSSKQLERDVATEAKTLELPSQVTTSSGMSALDLVRSVRRHRD